MIKISFEEIWQKIYCRKVGLSPAAAVGLPVATVEGETHPHGRFIPSSIVSLQQGKCPLYSGALLTNLETNS
jgi:hypothetical protein